MKNHVICSAPGRLCLLGEYSTVVKEAIVIGLNNYRTYFEIQGENDGIKVTSLNKNELVDLSASERNSYTGHWSDYIKASIRLLNRKYGIKIDHMKLSILSQVPTEVGLSSSAALTVSAIGGILTYLEIPFSNEELAEYAYLVEHNILGYPIGKMDPNASAFGKLMYINCGIQSVKKRAFYNFDDQAVFLIGNTGITKKTSVISKQAGHQFKEADSKVISHVKLLHGLIASADQAFQEKVWDLPRIGGWLTEAQNSLRDNLQVSTERLDTFCAAAIVSGAYGAKLTGSGKGGCMFALCSIANATQVRKSLEELGGIVYDLKSGDSGFQEEKDMQSLNINL